MSVTSRFFMIYYGFILLISLAFGVISYILQSSSMYTIARRRGINNPWLAWIPVANMWLLGCISDQFRSIAYGEYTNRRRTLLVLNIIVTAASIPLMFIVFTLLGRLVENPDWIMPLASAGKLTLFCFALLGMTIPAAILQYKCYFDLFRSCEPNRSVLYLILSLLIAYPLPFFMFSCRNKDLGMPQRNTPAPDYYR